MYQLVMLDDGGTPRAGVLRDGSVAVIPDIPAGEDALLRVIGAWDRLGRHVAATSGRPRPEGRVHLLAPLMYPGKILAAGANYSDHAREMAGAGATGAGDGSAGTGGTARPGGDSPYLFMKPSRHCVIGPGAAIRVPPWATRIDWEVELAVVIGREARRIPVERALEYVWGYTVMNDITSRDLTRRSDIPFRHDWLSGKGLDTFGPMGPALTPREFVPDPGRLSLHLKVNGEVMQDSTTAGLIYSVPALVAYASSRCTLDPGDVIMTGTPAGVGAGRGVFLKPGDVVEAYVERIGTLVNRIEAEP